MPWIYNQFTGELFHNDKFVGKGYSGKGEHKNQPASESIKNWGPIPKGTYIIGGYNNNKGPMTIILNPAINNVMYGRNAFRIHGDSISSPGNASEGCIILGPHIRINIIHSSDRVLTVI